MRVKLIVFEILLLAGSVGLFLWSGQSEMQNPVQKEQTDAPAFPNISVNQIRTIELHHGDQKLVFRKQASNGNQSGDPQQSGEEQSEDQQQATQEQGAYRPNFQPDWVLSSFHNYGVQRDLVDDRILKPLRRLKHGVLRGQNKKNLEDFGLDEDNGRRIVLKDKENKVLKEIMLGDMVTGFEERGPGDASTKTMYYYEANTPEGKFEVRQGETTFSELPLDPQEWVYKKILSFEDTDVQIIGIHDTKKEKLYVLRRKPEVDTGGTDSSDDNEEEDTSGNSEDTSDDQKSITFSDWSLYVGDYYADQPIPLGKPVELQENRIQWSASIPLTKEELNQSKADSLFNTLSSLEAAQVESPLTISSDRNRIPDKQLAKYGFEKPVSILYLGGWYPRKGKRKPGVLFNARYFVGQKGSDDEEDYYFSSLQTRRNTIKQLIWGGGATKQVPVYTLSSMDREDIVNPKNLIKEEDKKDKKGKGKQDSKNGEASPKNSSNSD